MTARTPGRWHWWTSNSFRRLKSDDRGRTHSVIEPTVARDGHPDLIVSAGDMAFIERACGAHDALVAALECHEALALPLSDSRYETVHRILEGHGWLPAEEPAKVFVARVTAAALEAAKVLS